MTQFVIIRGRANDGKTTACGVLYSELLTRSEPRHEFMVKSGSFFETDQNSLVRNSSGAIEDFLAIITINGSRIGIISEGDYPEPLKRDIDKLLKLKLDVIVCCARSRNTENSAYRMLLEKIYPIYRVIDEYWVPDKSLENIDRELSKIDWARNLIGDIINFLNSN